MRRPSERLIGARIRIKSERYDSVAAIFSGAGLVPIYIDHCPDGAISFWFDKPAAGNPAFVDAVRSIPLEDWAHYAIAGGFPTIH